MKGISWGSVYPKFANFLVIGTFCFEKIINSRMLTSLAIVYSCIAPLTLGFAGIGIYFYYLSYRYTLLFTMQAKIDTRGESYGTALQHVLSGVYLSEICLLGLFSIQQAPGPSVMVGVLLILTIFYHLTLNRVLKPVEQILPRTLRQEDEEAPLIDSDEHTADASMGDTAAEVPHIRSQAPNWVPSTILHLAERLFLPDANSHRALRTWFEDPDASDPPQPSVEQLANAYRNPALTSKIPKLWLVRDELKISAREIDENEKSNISTTDDGAELDDKNHIVWDMRNGGSDVPIFKAPVIY